MSSSCLPFTKPRGAFPLGHCRDQRPQKDWWARSPSCAAISSSKVASRSRRFVHTLYERLCKVKLWVKSPAFRRSSRIRPHKAARGRRVLALLVALLDPGVEVRIVTRRNHRVGELGAEEAQLLQGAAKVVCVGGARRFRQGFVELTEHVHRVAADHEVALGEAG